VGQRPDELEEQEEIRERDHEIESDVDHATAATRQEIELTRAEMTSTIDAIHERLDPEALSEHARDTAHDVTDYAIREAKEAAREITAQALTQAKDAVRDITGQATLALREATVGKVENMARTATDSAGGLRHAILETIKVNPLPAALVGLGLGWMFLNRPNGPTSQRYASTYPQGYGVAAHAPQQTAGQMVERTQAATGQVVDQVQATTGVLMHQMQQTGEQVVEQVQEQASRAQSFLQRQVEENPFLVGAVAVAIGGVFAGTVPSTSREDEVLGDTHDRVMGGARELTQETMHKLGRVVDEAQSRAKEEAREQSLVSEGGSHGRAS
jgi:hypothetical protein